MNILFVGAHTDDIEIGAGATLHQFAKQDGCNVYYLAMSQCRDLDRNKDIENDQLAVRKYLYELGVREVLMHNLRNRYLPEQSDMVRAFLETARDNYRPTMVFTHWTGDVHQDHKAVAEETLRVFKSHTILAYEVIRSCPQFPANFFVDLDPEDLEGKVQLLSLYKTQKELYYVRENTIRALAVSRATEIGRQLAEGFHVVRFVTGT